MSIQSCLFECDNLTKQSSLMQLNTTQQSFDLGKITLGFITGLINVIHSGGICLGMFYST